MNGNRDRLDALDAIRAEVSKVVLGQTGLIEKLLIALLADGHIILEGVSGLAKTQVIGALGKATGSSFRRIQLLPDMLPSDITVTPDSNYSDDLSQLLLSRNRRVSA